MMTNVCEKYRSRYPDSNYCCVFNNGLLGVCLCEKLFYRRNEDWTDEEKQIMAAGWDRLIPKGFDK